jgi:hypothetical protein
MDLSQNFVVFSEYMNFTKPSVNENPARGFYDVTQIAECSYQKHEILDIC